MYEYVIPRVDFVCLLSQQIIGDPHEASRCDAARTQGSSCRFENINDCIPVNCPATSNMASSLAIKNSFEIATIGRV